MIGCPNVNSPEWRALVDAVGEFQAMKDWMQYEDIRTPEDVKFKLLKSKPFSEETGAEIVSMMEANKSELQATMETNLLIEQDQDLEVKSGQAYVFLNTKDSEAFEYLLKREKAFPKEFKVTKKTTKYEKDPNRPGKFNPYNVYEDYFYIKSNKNKKSNLYDVVNKTTGEVIASKVRLIHLSKDVKSEIAENYGLEFKPTKVFSADRSISFVLYRLKPSKAKYIAQAKKYVYDAIKFLNPEETGKFKINLDKISEFLEAFPEEMWDYINATYSPEDSTMINASTNLTKHIRFELPKLGFLQELEKVTGLKLQDAAFKNYDRSGSIEKVLRIPWGEMVVIDYESMTKKQLRIAVKYFLNKSDYFKPSSEQENVRKYAEHKGVDYEKLKELVFGDIDNALEHIAYNRTGNSDTIELSKWRQSIKEYDWQMAELFSMPNQRYNERVKDKITEKFKDKALANGISHLDYFFSGNFNWVNINFNNISGQYFEADMETEAYVGVESKVKGFLTPFQVKTYQKPKAGKTFLKEEEVFNRLAAVIHEPFHALHALSYGTKEELALRSSFDRLANTDFGREMLSQVFGDTYNNMSLSYDTMYKEFVAFTGQLILYPKQWIDRTNLRSNDIYEFIMKIQNLQDKTYKEIQTERKKLGTEEKTIQVEEEIKLSFLEKLYNFIVKALNDIIPLSKKFFEVIKTSRIVDKTVVNDVFGEERTEVEKVKPLPQKIKKSKEEFLNAMEEFKSAINTLMQIDGKMFSSDNIYNFFSNQRYEQEAKPMKALVPQKVSEPRTLEGKFKKEIGLKNKELSFDQRWRMLGKIRSANAKLGTSFYVKFQQVGQANIFTWKILDYKPGDILTEEEKKQIPPKVAPAITPQSEQKGGDQLSLFYREINSLPTATELMNEQYPADELVADTMSIDNAIATDTLVQYADAISQNLNVPYEIIDEETAKKLTEDTIDPWDGEPALFYGNKVYFVKDRVKLNMVFHEFAHPLIRAIRLQNPQLYKNLLTKLSSTNEGQQLIEMVKNKYPKLERFTDEMMDEVLVRAVESAAMDIKQSVGFAKFIKDLMFAIRQLLRKVFGQKITVQNLNPDSTFKDLAEMLMPGNQITMDLSKIVTQDDIVNYYKDTTDYLESLEALETIAGKDYKTMQELIDRNAQNIISHLSRLEKRQNLGDILDIFKNEFGENMLAKMKGDLGRYSSLLNQKLANITKDAAYMRNASSSLLTTLHNLDVITTKVENHLEKMDRKDRSTIYKAAYYKDFLKDWAEFLEEGEDFLSRNKAVVPKTHPLVNMLGRIRSSITNSKKIIQDIDFEGFNQMLRLELQTSMDNIDKRYNEIFEHLKKINAPESQFKKWQAEYDKVKLTPEKIEKTLRGELGDANPLNSFLEGYLYNTDPVIGGFALYVKNNMTDVLVRASARHNDFIKKLMPLLEDWGKYRPSREGELGELLGFLDTIGYKDADGKFVTKEVWALLNNFIGYREVVSKFLYDIEELSKKAIGYNKTEDKLELLAKKREFNKFLIQYMHQKYIPAYYQRLEMLWKDEIGENLEAKMDEIFEQMNALNQPTSSQEDILGTMDKLGKLWRDYSRLSSETDLKGNPKTGMDLLIAKRMQEYKAASKDMYDFVPKDRAFAEAYEAYEQDLINNYARGFKGAQNFVNSLEFQQYMDKFLKKNLRTTIKENFWEDRAKKFEELKLLMAASPVSATLQKELTDAYDEMRNLTKFYKDSDNQIIGSEMSPELQTKITRLEQKIEKIKRDIKKEKKVKGKRLNRVQLNQIRKKLREISDMQTVEATDYYIDAVNEFIADIEPTDLMLNKLGGSQINRETVDEFLRSLDIIDYLKGKSPEFAEWFDRNHIEDVYIKEIAAIDPETGDPVGATEALPMFRRSPAWNVIMPRDSKYYKTFTFVKSDGTPVTVPGEPSLRFYNRVVKPEYHTGYDFNTGRIRLVVGVHVDNKSTEPNLPRMDVADRKFINQRYIDMSKADPSTDDGKLFKILELIKEYHLENQKGLDMSKKLYYDFPRYHKNIVEILQTKDLFQKKWSAMGLAFRRIADFFRKAKDDPDSGLNPEDTWNLVRADMFDDTTAKIPMTGLVGLDAEQTSTNILDSITKYMLAAEKNKKLIEMSPYADAIKSILGDKKQYGVKDLKSINKFNFLYRGLVTFLTKKGESVREKAINNFIEREFEGVKNTGLLSGNAFANKLSQMMFKRASFGFFALNFPSALKNQLGAKFQGLIEAACGKYYNIKHFAAAEGWSLQLMKDISFNIYEKGELPVNIQLFNMFDPSEGRTEEKLGEGMSRTLLRDVANMTWLLNFRKWTELQATAQQFGAMMKGKKVKMNGEDIEYLDAWEVRDGKLQTKAGVDAAWSLTYDDEGNPIIGAEFKNFRNTVQAVIRDLNGAYSEFAQPEAQRFLVFRYFSYLRKFFTTMLLNRFGFAGSVLRPLPRLNVGFGDVKEGYYITTAKVAMRTLLNIGKMLPYATPEEKRALIKLSVEVGTLVTMSLLLAPLFGWDPDDEDRFEKLREKSGALPFFGLTEQDSYYPFHMSGWLSNQALNLMMQVRAENEQFLPLPGFGLDDYGAFLDIKSIAAGPTLKKYGQIFEDIFLAASEDNRGFYQRDVGPYTWQQEESAKIWNHLFSTFGLTGSSLDPAVAVKNFQGIQARAR